MLERIKRHLEINRSITNEWADLVTDGRDAERRRILAEQGPEAAEAWVATQDKLTQRIAKRPRI